MSGLRVSLARSLCDSVSDAVVHYIYTIRPGSAPGLTSVCVWPKTTRYPQTTNSRKWCTSNCELWPFWTRPSHGRKAIHSAFRSRSLFAGEHQKMWNLSCVKGSVESVRSKAVYLNIAYIPINVFLIRYSYEYANTLYTFAHLDVNHFPRLAGQAFVAGSNCFQQSLCLHKGKHTHTEVIAVD